eukprot:2691860-Amphidinium_carterae.1
MKKPSRRSQLRYRKATSLGMKTQMQTKHLLQLLWTWPMKMMTSSCKLWPLCHRRKGKEKEKEKEKERKARKKHSQQIQLVPLLFL